MSKGEVIAESAVRFVRTLPAAPEKVWTFLTDSARLPEWYGDGAIEPREGCAQARREQVGLRPTGTAAQHVAVGKPATCS